ncbi:MAG: ATP-dependent helicase [Planctomycetota bacterium]|nr:MAG: ATP-dependent helicase [Planctomycetota bacterium]
MSQTVFITPSGRLTLEQAPELPTTLERAAAARLTAAFNQSSAEGLLWLCSEGLHAQLAPALVFWRAFGQRFFHDLCHAGEEGDLARKWRQLELPPEAELDSMIAAAPPMRGLEYLSRELLGGLWDELRQLIVERGASYAGGPQAFLRDVNPIWHLLGKVTFHLAENKRDEQRPFAFLATYTRRVSEAGRLQHVPLGQALKDFAGKKNQARLAALLEPVRAAASESPLVRELLESRRLFQPQAWPVHEAYRFLTEVPRLEASGVVVRVPDWWTPRQPPRPQVRVRLGQRPASQLGLDGLLDFSAELALDGEPLSESERRQLLAASAGLVLLRGRWVEVNGRELQEALDHWRQLEALHADGISFVEGMRLLAGTPIDGEEPQDATANWSQLVAGDWLRETLKQMRQPAGIEALRPGVDLQATLRPYQVEGVRWLWFMTRLGLGACLADDMGLGKTIQVIDLLLQLKREASDAGSRSPASRAPNSHAAKSPPSLLVVPASLLGNWRQELVRFAPTLRAFYAHPSETEGDRLARVAENPADALAGVDLVVTTYGVVRRSTWLRALAWRMVVLDEAQAIKNATSAQSKAVKQISAPGRIALTGTPVENHVGELWSIFDFCCPGLLGSAADFKRYVKRLNSSQDAEAFAALRRLVQPYILRRLKTDPHVAGDLPEKTEMRVECGLSKKQAVLYEQAVVDLARRLEQAEKMARRGLVLSALMHLKQICNHPSQYLNQAEFPPSESAKFDRLAGLCEPIVQRQEKALIFTQYQTLCQPLADFLAGEFGRSGLTLSGKTPVRRRAELVRQFQQDAGPPFFVISLKAGGSGLNLTAASHVIHFDRWWNPAVENQATDRAFRIGQKRNVLVHKFVCRGTVEERIDQMIRDKQGLADRLLASDGEPALTEMNDDQLLKFVSLDLNRALAES